MNSNKIAWVLLIGGVVWLGFTLLTGGPVLIPKDVPIETRAGLIIYENDDLETYPVSQRNIISSTKVRALMRELGADFAAYDQDKIFANPTVLSKAMEADVDKRTTLPWLLLSDPDHPDGYRGPLPEDIPAFEKLARSKFH